MAGFHTPKKKIIVLEKNAFEGEGDVGERGGGGGDGFRMDLSKLSEGNGTNIRISSLNRLESVKSTSTGIL